MATPGRNSTPASRVDPAAEYLISGTKWGGGLGSGVTLSYSFPTGLTHFASSYSSRGEWTAWSETSGSERVAIRDALSAWASVADIAFVRTADNRTTVGELRFAKTAAGGDGEAAHAYGPSTQPLAGDVWFQVGAWHDEADEPIVRGSRDYLVILHEIGHALGLKHSFERPFPLPDQLDDFNSTVMSYTAWAGIPGDRVSFYPTTPMYYDLAAIQTLYGRAAHNAGNSTYTFREGMTYFETLDDSGGRDTIVYAGDRACRIDLREGYHCRVSEPITLGDGSATRATVWIGPDTRIERAKGGDGNDAIVGNGLNNTLYGRGGRDTLTGGLGRDTLLGGSDADRFDFNSIRHSVPGDRHDRILNFDPREGDRIDLSSIDADTSRNPGNDTFDFVGGARFEGGGGELRYARGLVQADVDGDKVADLEIGVPGVRLHADDFIL